MIEPHQRAALIPAQPGVPWYSFLQSRFVEPRHSTRRGTSLAIVVQAIQPQSQILVAVQGIVEISLGSALPVVSAFVGQLNLDSREFTLRQSQPDKTFTGQVSENGRVMQLCEVGQSKPVYLVHEPTLAQLV